MSDLIPPDLQQCQCDITPAYNPWRVAGETRQPPERCKNKPVWLAVEKIAGSDGQCGAMSLCQTCAEEMLKIEDLRRRVQLQPIFE